MRPCALTTPKTVDVAVGVAVALAVAVAVGVFVAIDVAVAVGESVAVAVAVAVKVGVIVGDDVAVAGSSASRLQPASATATAIRAIGFRSLTAIFAAPKFDPAAGKSGALLQNKDLARS